MVQTLFFLVLPPLAVVAVAVEMLAVVPVEMVVPAVAQVVLLEMLLREV
jgi:hypothetical protein